MRRRRCYAESRAERGEQVLKRGRSRAAIPRLRHEQVVEKFVDYHFGRLSPEMNIAIERHVRSCARCKREGLTHAANERKGAARQLRGVRGGKPLLSRRTRNILFALLVIAIAQLVVYQIINGRAGAFISLLSLSSPNTGQITSTQGPVVALRPDGAFPLVTTNASAIALSSDDKRIAIAQTSPKRVIAVWDIASKKVTVSLPWPDATAPTSIAWSADGSRLAAVDGSQILVWDVGSGSVLWQLSVPTAPAMRVYDIGQQTIIARPDPASAFASGALAWGADGALNAAPVGALGPVGVSTPQAPVVGMWSSAGSHLFAGSGGASLVGASASDAKAGVALLDWSPDGKYLLWGALSQPVAVGVAQSAKATSHPPDSVVGQLAQRIAQAGGSANALVWFAPVGKLVAVCDQTIPGAHIEMIVIATGRVAYRLDEVCTGMTAHSAVWSSSGANFYVVPPSSPVESYTIPS